MDCARHFEKILHDKAQLARVYLLSWAVTGNEFVRTIAEEILDRVICEITHHAHHRSSRPLKDNATPSADAMAVAALLRLAGFTQ